MECRIKQLHASVLTHHSVRVDYSHKVKAVEVLLEVPLETIAGQGQTVDIAVVPVQAHREVIAEVVKGHLPMIAKETALTKAAVAVRVEVGVQVEGRIVIEIMSIGDADRSLDHVPKSVGGVESQ